MPTVSPTSPIPAARSWRWPAIAPTHVLATACAVLLAAAGWRLWTAASQPLWLDELYTTTLVSSPSLAHVWDGALRGVDGNPPLYLSLAWLVTRGLAAEPERLLAPLNLVFLAGTAALLYRIGRRMADPVSVLAGLAALTAVDGMVPYALVEIRTYALYLVLVTATLAATLRVFDHPTAGRTVALAGLGVLATLSHSFGGFYVLATLSAAALVAQVRRDRALLVALAAAAVPCALVLLAWIRVSFAAQLAVATPYGWIPTPGSTDLLIALTGSFVPTLLLVAGLLWWGIRTRPGLRHFSGLCHDRPDVAAIAAIPCAFMAMTVAGWIGSHLVTPFFVPRYFIPNVIVGALLAPPALAAIGRRVDRRLFGAAAAACVAMAATAVAVDGDASGRAIPCRDEADRFLEDGFAGDGTPVVAESPHAWLPRTRYAPAQVTLYPLDWDVVLRFPTRARNNAMDFHIMEILRDWAAPGTPLATRVLTTDAVLERHPHLLVLDEDGRSWFTQLRARMPVSARMLREGRGCRLWDVTLAGQAETRKQP